MNKDNRKSAISLLVLVFILLACAFPGLENPAPVGVTPQALTVSPIPNSNLTEITPTYEGCAYVWASHDLPELSKKVNAALQAKDSKAGGSAYAYGEDCVYADGHGTFSAMETDFRVQILVQDLKDEASLGNWIVEVMSVIDALPPTELSGPQPGRVDIEFRSTASENLFLHVSILKYRQEAQGLKGPQLFKLFYNNP
jgi:hypothetical protein